MHYWADLQSVYGLRCCGNITRTRNVSEYVLVFAVCLVDDFVQLMKERVFLTDLEVACCYVVVELSNSVVPGSRDTVQKSSLLVVDRCSSVRCGG